MGALGLKEIELQCWKHLKILLCQVSLTNDLKVTSPATFGLSGISAGREFLPLSAKFQRQGNNTIKV